VNATLTVMGLLAGAFFFGSVVWFAKNRTVWRFLQLFGSACLMVVVLTHIVEMFDLFPRMGWGLPNSVGHYLDFVSAVLAFTLLSLGILDDAITRRITSN
jgi:hypothetical protein